MIWRRCRERRPGPIRLPEAAVAPRSRPPSLESKRSPYCRDARLRPGARLRSPRRSADDDPRTGRRHGRLVGMDTLAESVAANRGGRRRSTVWDAPRPVKRRGNGRLGAPPGRRLPRRIGAASGQSQGSRQARDMAAGLRAGSGREQRWLWEWTAIRATASRALAAGAGACARHPVARSRAPVHGALCWVAVSRLLPPVGVHVPTRARPYILARR